MLPEASPSPNHQVGLVSWGPLICGKSGVPGVLADVSKALPWVRKVLAGKGTGQAAVEAADKVAIKKKTLVWNGQVWRLL